MGHAFPVHPHACGDYIDPPPAWGLGLGPSPRVWGLHMTRTAKTFAHPPLRVCKGKKPKQGGGLDWLVKLHASTQANWAGKQKGKEEALGS